MATGSTNKRVAGPRTDLLLFTGRRRGWDIIGALSVMTLKWRDF